MSQFAGVVDENKLSWCGITDKQHVLAFFLVEWLLRQKKETADSLLH